MMKANQPVGAVLWLLGLGLASGVSLQAQHAHIYAGAASPTPGTPLFFQNADLWDTNSYGGYRQSPACLYFEDNFPEWYPGLYQTATTFSALPATIFTGGPSPFAAALGAYVELKFISLQGPAGGGLTVWDENTDPERPIPLFTLPTGESQGTNRLNLSEGDPLDPGADPYGHIHGRRYTLDKPGLYVVGLQLVDTSLHGPGGGSIHTASAVTYFYLQAGLGMSDVSRSNHVLTARFGLPGFSTYALEAGSNLPGTNWQTVATVPGTSHSELRWVHATNSTAPNQFYRLRKIN